MTSFAFYAEQYGGNLPETEFYRLRARSAALLSSMTMGRSGSALLTAPVQNSVDMAICAMVDVLGKEILGGDVVSESNDGISRTYAAKVQRTQEQELNAAARVYLAHTGLLYRGCCF